MHCAVSFFFQDVRPVVLGRFDGRTGRGLSSDFHEENDTRPTRRPVRIGRILSRVSGHRFVTEFLSSQPRQKIQKNRVSAIYLLFSGIVS